MEITANKLKMFLDTNIPGKKEKHILFTRNILYIPITNITNINYNTKELPFFNIQYKYPKSILNNLTYDKCINFFFVKNTFIEIINTHVINNSLTPATTDKEKKDIIDFNINTMVELLFPTKYPTMNNHYDSYENNILGISPGLSFKGSLGVFEKILPSNLRTNYSYISIDNKKYTVVKTTILNDVFNHPGYNEMIESYNKINLIRMESNIKKKIKDIIDKFYIITNKIRLNNMFNELRDKLQKIINDEQTRREREAREDRVRYKIDVEFISNFITLLETIISTDNTDELNITNMETLSENSRSDKISMYIPTKINKMIKEVKDILDQYELLNIILKIHLTNGTININFDKKIQSIMKDKYKNYYNFGKELLNNKNFKSTNTDFQKMLDDFIDNKTSIFSQYMKTITQIIDGKIIPKSVPTLFDIFYVGLRYIDDDDEYNEVYEVYVKLDVFGGILNDNIDIGCNYRGEELGNYLENKQKITWKVKDGIFIDIDDIIKKTPQQNKKKGGRRRNYTLRRRIINNNTKRMNK
jgi:hypothetical protein